MTLTIPKGTATDAIARLFFSLVDATDKFTPENLGAGDDGDPVTGQKAWLSFGGGAFVESANDIVKVSGAFGEYFLELDDDERNNAIAMGVRGHIQPTGCAYSKLQGQIGPAAAASEPVSSVSLVAAIAAELQSSGVALTSAQSTALRRAVFRAMHYLDGFGVARNTEDTEMQAIVPGDAAATVPITPDTGRPSVIAAGAGVP